MRKSPPVDTMPEFEELNVCASNLMLTAKSYRAQGEVFEGAVAWLEAGRTLTQLGSKLLHAEYNLEAADDLLSAAECFLEAGDYRPAKEQLDRFTTLPELQEVLRVDRMTKEKHARISEWSAKSRRAFERAFRHMRDQMKDPEGAHRLTQGWLDATLSQMPGVWEFHWFAGRKHGHAAEKQKSTRRRGIAIDHHRWCVRLRPDDEAARIVLVSELLDAGHWEQAVSTADGAVERFPKLAVVLVYAGFSRYLFAVRGQGPKSLRAEAVSYMKQAVELGQQLTEKQLVLAHYCLAGCLHFDGKEEEAKRVLRNAIDEHPGAASDVLLRMLRAPRIMFEVDAPWIRYYALGDTVRAESLAAVA